MFTIITLIGITGVVILGVYMYIRSKNLPKDTSRKPVDAHTALGIRQGNKQTPVRRASSIQPSNLDWYTGSKAIEPVHESIIKAPGPWANDNTPAHMLHGIDRNGNLINGQENPF